MSDTKNSFRFLDVDVSEKTSELTVGRSKKIKYLEWAKVLILLREQDVNELRFGVEDNTDGYPAFYDVNGNNPFIKVWVVIDGEKYSITYPVIANQGTTFKVVERPSQLDMEFSKARAFVKCVAINTGLGLKLWLEETQQLANVVDEASMDNKQLTEELEESTVKIAMALKSRVKALELLGTSKTQFDEFCNRHDLIAFEQKMGWYKTLKVAIHNLDTIEKLTLKKAEQGINTEETQKDETTVEKEVVNESPTEENSQEAIDFFCRFLEEKEITTYEQYHNLLVGSKPSADDLKVLAARLKVKYDGKLKSRKIMLDMWNECK